MAEFTPHDIEGLVAGAPQVTEAYDTITPGFVAYTEQVADELVSRQQTPSTVDRVIRERIGTEGLRDTHVIAARTMLKIIQGGQDAATLSELLNARGERLTVAPIQPMYHESSRISARGDDNPHGENALRYKLTY